MATTQQVENACNALWTTHDAAVRRAAMYMPDRFVIAEAARSCTETLGSLIRVLEQQSHPGPPRALLARRLRAEMLLLWVAMLVLVLALLVGSCSLVRFGGAR